MGWGGGRGGGGGGGGGGEGRGGGGGGGRGWRGEGGGGVMSERSRFVSSVWRGRVAGALRLTKTASETKTKIRLRRLRHTKCVQVRWHNRVTYKKETTHMHL